MSSSWNTFKLGDIADIGSSKRIKMADYVSEGVPFYRSKEIIEKNKGNQISTELFITEKKFGDIEKKFGAPKELDILLTSVGTLGVPYQVQKNERFYFKDGNLTWLRNFRDFVNPRYIYFWLTSSIAKRKIDEVTIGSTQQALTIVALKSLTIDLPSLKIQNIIVQHLEALDGKIAINRQTNQTLEQMAQALFKSWFVDFDPVVDNALAAGNPIPEELAHRIEVRKKAHALPASLEGKGQPLPEHIRNLFPSEFEQTGEPAVGIGGWVPKGWQITSMHEMVETISKTYNLKEVNEVIFLNTGDIESGKILHNEYSPTIGLPGQAKKTIKKGDILYSEIRPQNKRYAFVDFDAEEYVVSTKLMVLRAKEGIEPLLPYFLLTQEETINELQRIAEHRSGTFPQITYKELSKVLTVLPQEAELVTIFVEQYLKPSYAKKASLTQQNTQLTKIRDTLLPKLISGEIQLATTEENNTNQGQELQGM
ncbi:MAG: restriction endonuclease subunit S [Alteromonadaceae bacterium TMED7]|nr:MAG: restriction endonuclease subunit S [Alteromonadaceae bacterium TMED7]|tara:strand:+ start:14689 stop:16131 length:1443 start_codon:yes stop_codon:yes gene_type:complete